MKVTRIELNDQCKNDVLSIGFDVSKRKLDYFSRSDDGVFEERILGQIENRAEPIKEELIAVYNQARKMGYRTLKVICEATGIYHRRLLRIAREMGFYTALVSGEAVHKSQVLESNDYHKSDGKDARTILLVSNNAKELKDRYFMNRWLLLRQLNLNYERLEREGTQIKNRIKQALFELFCDLSFKSDWIFKGRACERITEVYGLNPYRIFDEGKSRMTAKMKHRGIRLQTINRLWDDVCQSILLQQDRELTNWLETEVRDLFARLKEVQDQRLKLRYRMVAEVDQLHEQGQTQLDVHKGPIGPFMMARILAETGPLKDFKHYRALWKYAGLNLCEKESGTMKGQDKISKKGRARLRRCAQQACLKLVLKKGLFGDYHHGKKQAGMAGNKSISAVSRKLLKLLHGLEKSGQAYNPQRVFNAESKMKKAA